MSAKRLYSFVNFYINSIGQGIQTQHVAAELTNKYVYQHGHGRQESAKFLKDWSLHHKTTIVLNGGINSDLIELYNFLFICDEEGHGLWFDQELVYLPFANFHEDEASLGGIITAVGIVLPEEIYDAVPKRQAEQIAGEFVLNITQQPDEGQFYYFYVDDNGKRSYVTYTADSQIGKFLKILKSCPLAR